jgi:hypothetical protein
MVVAKCGHAKSNKGLLTVSFGVKGLRRLLPHFRKVPKHASALIAVAIGKPLIMRHAPGRAQTCNPIIPSYELQNRVTGAVSDFYSLAFGVGLHLD